MRVTNGIALAPIIVSWYNTDVNPLTINMAMAQRHVQKMQRTCPAVLIFLLFLLEISMIENRSVLQRG